MGDSRARTVTVALTVTDLRKQASIPFQAVFPLRETCVGVLQEGCDDIGLQHSGYQMACSCTIPLFWIHPEAT